LNFKDGFGKLCVQITDKTFEKKQFAAISLNLKNFILAEVIMQKPGNCIITIFGASGDLTKRKLIPALFVLYQKDLLPINFAILGVGRTEFEDDSFREKMRAEVTHFAREKPVHPNELHNFLAHIYYHTMDSGNSEAYPAFKQKLLEIDQFVEARNNFIFYLATTPGLYAAISTHLGQMKLNKEGADHGWNRIIFEKPFGFDLESAQALNRHIQQIFNEEQIYRIDHYLGKETVQNILAFRFANGIFEPLWNRNFIHHVEVTAAERIGVEDRGKYYESAGALRDMVQNHLLQVVATIAMEPPAKFDARSVRNEKVKIFQSLCPITPQQVAEQVVRGQYVESTIPGKKVAGYRSEKNVASNSRTETFVALKLFIDNWRWGDVPFFIRTGKALPTRVTEVAIHFKKTPHRLFKQNQNAIEDNQLIIRIQPDEGIILRFGMKTPGAGFQIKAVDMDFHYKDLGETELPEAYERLLLDCIQGDPTLYARSDAVEAGWSFITPILKGWQENPDIKLYGYPAGSWGPREASALFDDAEEWRRPAEALIDQQYSIEL
jgi:glucose-6-phosphate 1-dehydrogenase